MVASTLAVLVVLTVSLRPIISSTVCAFQPAAAEQLWFGCTGLRLCHADVTPYITHRHNHEAVTMQFAKQSVWPSAELHS